MDVPISALIYFLKYGLIDAPINELLIYSPIFVLVLVDSLIYVLINCPNEQLNCNGDH